MNNKKNSQKKVDDIIDTMEKSDDISEVQNIILNNIKPECREVTNMYFKCMQEKVKKLSEKKKIKKEQYEEIVQNQFNPYCLKKYNFELCLTK